MKAIISFIAVLVLAAIAYAGVEMMGLHYVFGVVIPYLAVATFVIRSTSAGETAQYPLRERT